MKKLLTFLLLAALVLPQNVNAMALLDPVVNPALPVMVTGTVVNVRENLVEVRSVRDESIIVLNMAARPYVVDCVTGMPVAFADRIDDRIIAWYGPITTRSFPPQSNPIAIIVNIPADFMPPKYGRVEAAEAEGNQVKVTLDGGSLIVTIGRDTPISPYLTRNIVTIDDIRVGTDLLMWYPFVAQSYPGQATAQKTVILGQTNLEAMSFTIPGATLEIDGVDMVALRITAEANGFTVIVDPRIGGGSTTSILTSVAEGTPPIKPTTVI